MIGIIAIFVVGPERLPHYAAQLARLTRSLRDLANGAKDRMREELGPDYNDVDWKKLDPRQYDPRRIIREALLDDPAVVTPPAQPARTTQSAYAQRMAKNRAATEATDAATAPSLAETAAHFDSEAT